MSPRILLAGSLAFSLLFNLVWATRSGVQNPADWLSIGAAVACTLIVPAGLGLWPQIPAKGFWARAFRALLMLGISAAAAVTSFSHSVDVLLSAYWSWWTAGAVTAGIELLVALSTMALRASGQVAEQAAADSKKTLEQALSDTITNSEQALFEAMRTGEQATEHPVEQTTNTPVPGRSNLSPTGPNRPTTTRDNPVRKLSAVHPDRSEDFRDWVSGLKEFPSGKAIRDRYGIGYGKANDMVARYRQELDEPADEEADREVELSS